MAGMTFAEIKAHSLKVAHLRGFHEKMPRTDCERCTEQKDDSAEYQRFSKAMGVTK